MPQQVAQSLCISNSAALGLGTGEKPQSFCEAKLCATTTCCLMARSDLVCKFAGSAHIAAGAMEVPRADAQALGGARRAGNDRRVGVQAPNPAVIKLNDLGFSRWC